MGIRHLETFICKNVPNGTFPINMEQEISAYQSAQDVVEPIIVIDIMSMYNSQNYVDIAGVLCGGRFNLIYQLLDDFFSKLRKAGARLIFFHKGIHNDHKDPRKISDLNHKYKQMIKVIDAIDEGHDLNVVVERFGGVISGDTRSPIKSLAKKHGTLRYTTSKIRDIVACANEIKAMAIVTNNTEYLIFKGSWRLWNSNKLNIREATTIEYNRRALLDFLQLNYDQMRLFGTLSGNEFIEFDEVKRFHARLGPLERKFLCLAEFVKKQRGVDHRLPQFAQFVFRNNGNGSDVVERLRKSLLFYDMDLQLPEADRDDGLVAEVLCQRNNKFLYNVWLGNFITTTMFMIDMRDSDIGARYPELILHIMQREAGIIISERFGSSSGFVDIVVKSSHDADYSLKRYPVQSPANIKIPPLLDLLSTQCDIMAELEDTKWALFCWIVSDSLDPQSLKSIPEKLIITVATLYYLLEKKVIHLFEADLFLQVGYDVAFETYAINEISYPTHLAKRPFGLVSVFGKIYHNLRKAKKAVGLGIEEEIPMFDGVLFHNRYAAWEAKSGDISQIKEFRIYESIA